MDGLGYRNWNNTDSYESSPSGFSDDMPRRSSYNSRGNSAFPNDKSEYDFEISNDDEDYADSPVFSKPKLDRRASMGAGRRSSIDERARDILERNKKVDDKETAADDDDDRMQSYKDTFADLMEGLDVPDYKKDMGTAGEAPPTSESPPDTSNSSSPGKGWHGRGKGRDRVDSPLESPMDTVDSFEISDADLEVSNTAISCNNCRIIMHAYNLHYSFRVMNFKLLTRLSLAYTAEPLHVALF